MQYNLKEKINITNEFLEDLINKSWQETEALQQQIANIDTNSKLGADVVKLLKNTCTSYYTLIGCLEALVDETEVMKKPDDNAYEENVVESEFGPTNELEVVESNVVAPAESAAEISQEFEPFEYFVDFDEPSGEPLTDKDLYN